MLVFFFLSVLPCIRLSGQIREDCVVHDCGCMLRFSRQVFYKQREFTGGEHGWLAAVTFRRRPMLFLLLNFVFWPYVFFALLVSSMLKFLRLWIFFWWLFSLLIVLALTFCALRKQWFVSVTLIHLQAAINSCNWLRPGWFDFNWRVTLHCPADEEPIFFSNPLIRFYANGWIVISVIISELIKQLKRLKWW